MSKTYRAVIEPNKKAISEWADNKYAVRMDRMELTFSVGDQAQERDPSNIARATLADLRLSFWMDVTSVEQIDPAECIGLRAAPELEPQAEYCGVCHKEHTSPEIVKVGKIALIPGHEYVIITKTSQQKYPREWRMGYLGYGAGLLFSARGPDRTHGGQYGGTQAIDMAQVVSVREVERDDAKRHIAGFTESGRRRDRA